MTADYIYVERAGAADPDSLEQYKASSPDLWLKGDNGK